MEKSKDDLKKLFKVIVFAVITYWVINNFNVIGDFIGNILSMASPFIWGAALAFILNIPMEAIEKRLVKPKRKNKKKRAVNSKIIRVFSLILSIVFIGFMLFLIVKLVVPELVNVVKLVIEKIPYYIDEDGLFTYDKRDNYYMVKILVLFVYAKLFESIVTVEGEDFFNAREEKECYKLVKELIKFVYEELGKLSNYNSQTANEELNKHMKKMFNIAYY